MKEIHVPSNFNYIGVFLTLRCEFNCIYCINHHGEFGVVDELSTEGWIEGLSRIHTRPDLPITLQGGEPSLHPGWMQIANALWRQDIPVDLLTNGDFNVAEFMRKVSPDVFKRDAKYASIRFSFHPGVHDAHALATKVLFLLDDGYSVGIWGLAHPGHMYQNEQMKRICRTYGIDFRMKEFLGEYKGQWYGEMKYKGACDGKDKDFINGVECRTTELLVNPAGYVFRCHSDLYAGRNPLAHILDEEIEGVGEWRWCGSYGACNPCDIKIKNNRLQEYGHTAVEIRGKGGEENEQV